MARKKPAAEVATAEQQEKPEVKSEVVEPAGDVTDNPPVAEKVAETPVVNVVVIAPESKDEAAFRVWEAEQETERALRWRRQGRR